VKIADLVVDDAVAVEEEGSLDHGDGTPRRLKG
jgi:hypothetical protein